MIDSSYSDSTAVMRKLSEDDRTDLAQLLMDLLNLALAREKAYSGHWSQALEVMTLMH